MSAVATGTPVAHGPEPVQAARAKVVGGRLLLGANASVQLSFLFAFLYLRANDNNGMWYPSGVTPPPGVATIVIQVLQVLALLAVVVAARTLASRRGAFPVGMLAATIVLGLACLGARVYQLIHTGWTPDQGTYVDVSVLWLAVIAAFILIGILWTVKILTNRALRDPLESAADLRAAAEYWGFMTATSLFVAGLVHFVH